MAAFVQRTIVLSLVDRWLATGKGLCHDPEDMKRAFVDLPVVDWYGVEMVRQGDARRVIDRFECTKLAAGCNAWTPWMLRRIFDPQHVVQSHDWLTRRTSR